METDNKEINGEKRQTEEGDELGSRARVRKETEWGRRQSEVKV